MLFLKQSMKEMGGGVHCFVFFNCLSACVLTASYCFSLEVNFQNFTGQIPFIVKIETWQSFLIISLEKPHCEITKVQNCR